MASLKPSSSLGAAAVSVAAHVMVESVPAGSQVELDDETAHHLASVLRLRPGEQVGATDGRGVYLPCRYAGRGRLEPAGEPVVAAPRSPVLTVGFAPVKGDRPEWAVQKLTELGVDRIVLLHTDRGVVRWTGARAESHLRRLEKVARAAVVQSRQVWLPAVLGPVEVGEFLRSGSAGSDAGGSGSGPGSDAGPRVAVAQMDGPPAWAGIDTALIGPEGGWSAEELSAAPALLGLGPSVLRAETAAVTAGVLMTAIRAGVVGAAPRQPGKSHAV